MFEKRTGVPAFGEWAKLARMDRAVVAVLAAGQRYHHTLTRTKVAKLLYLADLEAVRQGLRPFTGVTWRWLHHGPFDNALLETENELVRAGAVKRTAWTWSGGYGYDLALTDGARTDDLLAEPFQEVLDRIVGKLGGFSAVSLKDMTYQTEPMLDAQEDGRGGLLDLWLVRPVPEISGAVSRMKSYLAEQPAQEDEAGSQDDLRSELMGLSAGRSRATSSLIRE